MKLCDQPAFPTTGIPPILPDIHPGEPPQNGMTLRTYAAIQIAAGMYAAESNEYGYSDTGSGVPHRFPMTARDAVKAADALLAELEKTP